MVLGKKERNPWLVLLFSFITLGIYFIYWLIETSLEMKEIMISPKWLFLIPGFYLIASLYIIFPIELLLYFVYFAALSFLIYIWFHSRSVYIISGFKARIMYLLWLFLTPAAIYFTQRELNKI